MPELSQEMPSIAEMLAQFFKRPKLVTGFNVQSTVRWVHLNYTREILKLLINEFSGEYLESMELLLEVLRLWGNRAKEESHKKQKS